MALTVRQKKFVQEYLRLGIGKEAAINAGYSPRSAEQQASRMLAMPEVQAYRRELEQKLFDEMGISEAWIGRRLVEIVDRSMTAVPHMVWDPDERKKVHDGDWVFDAGNAIKALHELAVQVGYAKGETETTEQRKSFEDWLAEQNRTSRL